MAMLIDRMLGQGGIRRIHIKLNDGSVQCDNGALAYMIGSIQMDAGDPYKSLSLSLLLFLSLSLITSLFISITELH